MTSFGMFMKPALNIITWMPKKCQNWAMMMANRAMLGVARGDL